MPERETPPETFEIGLVMAGAVSAGSYTAGILDFLFEAIQEWENEKLNNPGTTPSHSIDIRVASGASAGGICSVLAAMLPFTGHIPVSNTSAMPVDQAAQHGKDNILFQSWVNAIDLSYLLRTTDVPDKSSVVHSLLDGTVLDEIIQATIRKVRNSPPIGSMAFMANPVQLYLTLTNNRGIPYLIQAKTAGGVRGHKVISHADYGHFAVYGANSDAHETLPPGSSPVNFPATTVPSGLGWARMGDAALASSAFPVGLPGRAFDNDRSVYTARQWPRPGGGLPGAPLPDISPDLPHTDTAPYRFWTVDGGVINNEPLEYARIALSGGPNNRNNRDEKMANRAVLMIDPFPEDTGPAAPINHGKPDILQGIFGLIGLMKNHCRFKPEEIVLALDKTVYSRFLIAPSREIKSPANGKIEETHLASDGLAGFSGFVDPSFRLHDFELGRRNCQKFLKDHFVIHIDNPIVNGWVTKMNGSGVKISQFHPSRTGNPALDNNYVQIIPLFGAALNPNKVRAWPKLDADKKMQALKPAIHKRVKTILPSFTDTVFAPLKLNKFLLAFARFMAKTFIAGKVTNYVMDAIRADLIKRNLN